MPQSRHRLIHAKNVNETARRARQVQLPCRPHRGRHVNPDEEFALVGLIVGLIGMLAGTALRIGIVFFARVSLLVGAAARGGVDVGVHAGLQLAGLLDEVRE